MKTIPELSPGDSKLKNDSSKPSTAPALRYTGMHRAVLGAVPGAIFQKAWWQCSGLNI